MNNLHDKAALLKAAADVRRDLELRFAADTFQSQKTLKAVKRIRGGLETDGWFVDLGGVTGSPFRITLWLDRWAGHEGRRFAYAFRIERYGKLGGLLGKLTEPETTFSQKNVETNGFARLRQKLPAEKFGTPIYENYGAGFRYYSMYDRVGDWSPKALRQVVSNAVNFFSRVLSSRMECALAETDIADVYAAFEPQVRREHLIRERNPRLAMKCKQRDDFQCQVCRKRFEDDYGDLGRGFAESHHIQALSQSHPGKKTRLEDLITVCANCHRMLHRMQGHKDDVYRLKDIVEKTKLKKSE